MTHDYRDVLLKAASIVEQGWCQGSAYRNAKGDPCAWDEAVASCAAGALTRAAIEESDDWGPGYFGAMVALRLVIPDPVEVWNDTFGRTADEVAAAMRRAAE